MWGSEHMNNGKQNVVRAPLEFTLDRGPNREQMNTGINL